MRVTLVMVVLKEDIPIVPLTCKLRHRTKSEGDLLGASRRSVGGRNHTRSYVFVDTL